jgi:hypothetical protein
MLGEPATHQSFCVLARRFGTLDSRVRGRPRAECVSGAFGASVFLGACAECALRLEALAIMKHERDGGRLGYCAAAGLEPATSPPDGPWMAGRSIRLSYAAGFSTHRAD